MMSVVMAEKRISDFERKYGEVALQLAYHAALPVALNTDLLHLLRINFFIDPPKSLPYTAEFELLLSPLCREIDEGLYEIEPEIRDILLQGLCSIDLGQRVKDVATLLWQYIDRDAVWIDRVELERAQQLTVLNFLDPAGAKDYLAEGEDEINAGQIAAKDWYVAMRQEIDRYSQLTEEKIPEEINRAEEIRQDFYREILEQHLDKLKEEIAENFTTHDYELSFGLHPRDIDELNIDEVHINDVSTVNITSISKSLDTDDAMSGAFEVSVQIVFSAEVTILNHDGFIREIHEDTDYPTIARIIPNQFANVTVRVTVTFANDGTPELEIEFIDMMEKPIMVNYQDVISLESDDSEDAISIYHRIEGGSQTVEIARFQEQSLEIWGGQSRNPYSSNIPGVQALIGSLPKGKRGIEFTTDVPPDLGTSPGLAYWHGDREELTIQGDFAILKVLTVKNFQSQIEIINTKKQDSQENSSSQIDEITKEAEEILTIAFESNDKVIFIVETNMYTHIIAGDLNFVDRPELLPTYQYAVAQLIEKGFITKMESTNCDRYELTSKGYKFCIAAAKSSQPDRQPPVNLNTMPVITTSKVGKATQAAKTTSSKKLAHAAKLRKIQENISTLRNSRSTDLEKISALKVLGRIATDNKQAIQVILFLIHFNKNNDVIAEAVKSLGKIGKKDTSVLQEMVRLLRSSSNNLVIIEVLTSLAKIGNSDSTTIRAILHLLALSKNSLVIINIMATFTVIAKGNNEVIQKILSLLTNSNDINVKKSIIASLGKIASGNKSAVNQLISILRFSPNTPIIKQFAANSLGKIAVGDKDVILAMESELRFSSSKTVKERVAVNLNKVDPGNKVAADYRTKIRKTRSTKKGSTELAMLFSD
jgi:hypothetical protein